MNKILTRLVKWLIYNGWMLDLTPRAPQFPIHGSGPFVIAFFSDGSYIITNVVEGCTEKTITFVAMPIYKTDTFVKEVSFVNNELNTINLRNATLVCGDELGLTIQR